MDDGDSPSMPPDSLYSARYPMAMAYAAVQHAAQGRKDEHGSPYIGHPMAVSAMVLSYGWGDPRFTHEIEELAIAALLHDVAEDTGGEAKLAEIDAMFGPRVAEVVRAASDSLVVDPAEKAPWRTRKEDHIARMGALASDSGDGASHDAGACLVIACDKLHNLTGTVTGVGEHGEVYLERFKGGADGTRWYYRGAFEALRPALAPPLVAALATQVAALEA